MLRRLSAFFHLSEDKLTRWHRWCTQHTYCDWQKNVDMANSDNHNGSKHESEHSVLSDERVDEFKAHLFGMSSFQSKKKK
jgi:hypothetical protein